MSEDRYQIRPLSSQHDRKAFTCGIEVLDRYFHQQAGLDRDRKLAVPYVLAEIPTQKVVGFYTLTNLSIIPSRLPDDLTRRLPPYKEFPAILIGRLAVDLRYQRRGFGELLLVDALRQASAISRKTGVMAVVADAKSDPARAFYERYGFTRFVDDEYSLLLPMTTIAKLEL